MLPSSYFFSLIDNILSKEKVSDMLASLRQHPVTYILKMAKCVSAPLQFFPIYTHIPFLGPRKNRLV